MKELLISYLQNPVLETFGALRQGVLAQEEFNPYSDELDGVDGFFEAGDFRKVVNTISEHLYPNHLLSPGAHMKLAFASHKIGDEERASAEQMIAAAMLDGIEMTGDGSSESPYVVTRTSDEYDLLFRHELQFVGQSLQERNGRNFDVVTVEGRNELWFDITDILNILNRKFEDG